LGDKVNESYQRAAGVTFKTGGEGGLRKVMSPLRIHLFGRVLSDILNLVHEKIREKRRAHSIH